MTTAPNGKQWLPVSAQRSYSTSTATANALSLFLPKKRPKVVPWLEENIYIPTAFSPADAGPFSIASRPYQREILECFHPDSGVTFCAASMGVQTAKTFVMICGVAFRIAHSPLPTLLVGSSHDWSKAELSEKRLVPLINENPQLARFKPSNSDQFRAMTMNMHGGVIQLVGGNSPGNLSGGSYGIVAIDEAAKLKRRGGEQTAEAHPIDLALMRTSYFAGSSFHYLSSTPNNSVHPFWQHILAGTQTHYWVECPHCREAFYFDFIGTETDISDYADGLDLDIPKDYRSVTWSQSARQANGSWKEDDVRASVRYICPHNGCEITESERFGMILGCQSKHHNDAASLTRRSFIIPSFYAPPVTFGQLATEFLAARGAVGESFAGSGLQNFYNSRRALPYEEQLKKVNGEQVMKLKGDYARGVIPSKPKYVFITADPGETANHWMVTAVLESGELAVIDYGTELSMDNLNSDAFRAARMYPVAGTSERRAPLFGVVDSGYATRKVFDMCASRQFANSSQWRWFPSHGTPNRSGVWSEVKVSSHPMLRRYVYSDHNLKSELYGEMIAGERKPGVVLPVDCEVVKITDGRGLISGLSGQTLIRAGGHDAWKKLAHDHFGDTLKLAVLALAITASVPARDEGRVR